MENQENQIILKQSPIITHQLQLVGKSVKKRIDDLELDKQIATEENVKSMKVLRAELNKEFKGYDEQRGIIKNAVTNPYLEFENVFKEEITERYKLADTQLKNSIDSVEFKIKKEKETNVKEYFDELVLSVNIDFLKFESLNLKFDLSTSEKKYKEQTNAFVMKVVDDLDLIKATDYEAETLTEYKTSLNVSKAITTVKTRKEKEAAEEAKIKAELIQNRKNALIKLGLNYEESTNCYELNPKIFVSLSDINNRTKEEFTAIHANIVVLVNAEKAKKIEVVETSASGFEKAIEETATKVVTTPLSAPKVEVVQEPINIASFEVKATLTKLRALGVYMKSQGIEYKNI